MEYPVTMRQICMQRAVGMRVTWRRASPLRRRVSVMCGADWPRASSPYNNRRGIKLYRPLNSSKCGDVRLAPTFLVYGFGNRRINARRRNYETLSMASSSVSIAFEKTDMK